MFRHATEESAGLGLNPELFAVVNEAGVYKQKVWDNETPVDTFLTEVIDDNSCEFLQLDVDEQTTCWYAQCELFEAGQSAVGSIVSSAERVQYLELLLSNSAKTEAIDDVLGIVKDFFDHPAA